MRSAGPTRNNEAFERALNTRGPLLQRSEAHLERHK